MNSPHSTAHSAAARHLRVVGEEARQEPVPPLVGYLVLVPEGTDPEALFAAEGVRAEFRPFPTREAREAREPRQHLATAGPPLPAGEGPAIDRERHTVEIDGRQLDLTYLEFELLAHLAANPHRVHTREQLVAALWGYSHVGDGRTVDVHIARLRRKLGPRDRERIVTVRRVGYKYEPDRPPGVRR